MAYDTTRVTTLSSLLQLGTRFKKELKALSETVPSSTFVVLLEGTVSSPVVLSGLDSGVYAVSGQYRVTDDGTVYVTSEQRVFMVGTAGGTKYITKFGVDGILMYTVDIDTGEISSDQYATQAWVSAQGYLKDEDLDEITDDFIAGLFD